MSASVGGSHRADRAALLAESADLSRQSAELGRQSAELGRQVAARDAEILQLQELIAAQQARAEALARMEENLDAVEDQIAGLRADRQRANRLQGEKNDTEKKVAAAVIGILIIAVIAGGITYGILRVT